MKKKTLGTILKSLIAVVFILSVVVVYLQYSYFAKGNYAYIYQDGELLYEIDLSDTKTKEYTIEYKNGTETGYNVVQVKDHKIGIVEADCPDKTCVHMGMTSSSSFPITCLPHKLIIEIKESNTSSDTVDIITH